jgi:hypothetical protein
MRNRGLETWAGLAVVGSLCLAAACGGAAKSPRKAPGSPPAAATRVVVYSPRGFRATATVDGYCWTGSLAAPRAGAYRCMAGNAVHDPCFVGVGQDEVACPQGDPDRQEGTVLRLTRALPPAGTARPSPSRPWAFTLQGGERCSAMTGTILPGHPYGCSPAPAPAGRARGALYCTPPSGEGPVYTVGCAPLSGQRSPGGPPTLGKDRTHRVAVMWL